jgi:CBS domain-containing protein
MHKKISEIMTSEVITLNQNDTISEAAKLMNKWNIGFIPLMGDDGKLAGAVTDRDLVLRGYAQGLSADTSLRAIMSKPCVTAPKDISVEEAADIMASKQIRRLCVVDEGRLVGVCTLGDISLSRAGKGDAGDALAKISQPALSGSAQNGQSINTYL